ncbi:protein kinase [Streptomyces sp. NPDC020490]|uniref:protein kinase domain-containing protein n=1 Tax=Streptomyces sp. NPDC020490 TaxID=3365078 RepID=UPI0037A272A0
MERRILAQRYELVEQLGRGGMGTVYRAVDRRLRREVAVKTLSAELARQPQFLARFRREAHAAAALNHPGIATVHDAGEGSGDGSAEPYLVMEYVKGRTLSDVVGDGPMPVAQAVDITGQVLEALEHSHRQAIVHRDIKPANVILTRGGTVKVLDFGIAKALSEAATRLTGTGVAVGTPAYLSPEQIVGDETDHRTDLYAVGCLLYELVTGRPPFTGESPFSVMHQHLAAEPVAPSCLRPELPAAMDTVILRALRKSRDDRFPDAAAMRVSLAEAALVAPASVSPSPTEVDPAARTMTRPAVAPRASADSTPPTPSPNRRRMGVVVQPSAEGLLALLGCLLSVMVSRTDAIEIDRFRQVALLAGVFGSVLLLWSARLACAVAWGPVAEAVAVQSGLARQYIGWDTHYVVVTLILGAVAAVCLVAGYRDAPGGGFALVAFWFTGLTCVWFFLDDLRKIGVFYALLLGVTIAVGTHVLKSRAQPPQGTDRGETRNDERDAENPAADPHREQSAPASP